ncbi:MAG: alkaline phosphatase family protein, partial [Myxococcota bacterium]
MTRRISRARSLAALFVALGCTPSKPSEEPGRVLVIGVDGAEWNMIEPLVAAGKMPNLRRLMKEGSYGDLETIEPILSPIIWTTIATGREPEDHGVTWFMERDPKTGATKPVTSRTRKTKAIWNIASSMDRSVGVVGWWASWPSERVDGWVISDHVAAHGFGLTARNVKTELGRTHPPDLYQSIAPLMVKPSQITDAEIREYMDVTEAELATRRGDTMQFSNPLHHFVFALSAHKT